MPGTMHWCLMFRETQLLTYNENMKGVHITECVLLLSKSQTTPTVISDIETKDTFCNARVLFVPSIRTFVTCAPSTFALHLQACTSGLSQPTPSMISTTRLPKEGKYLKA